MRCKALSKSSGKQCRAGALPGHEFCFWHEPTNERERVKARKKGGKYRRVEHAGDPLTLPQTFATVEDVNKILDYVLAEVLPMSNSIARARLLLSIHDSFLRAIEIGELENRIAALEAMRK